MTKTKPASVEVALWKRARMLCDDLIAREMAGQEFAPDFDKSAPHVQRYWLRLAALKTEGDA